MYIDLCFLWSFDVDQLALENRGKPGQRTNNSADFSHKFANIFPLGSDEYGLRRKFSYIVF